MTPGLRTTAVNAQYPRLGELTILSSAEDLKDPWSAPALQPILETQRNWVLIPAMEHSVRFSSCGSSSKRVDETTKSIDECANGK